MRISLLLQREPFGEILCATLERFLPQLTGHTHQVKWYHGKAQEGARFRRGGNSKANRHAGEQTWLCNFYLNAIFTSEAGGETLEPVMREFGRSAVWWRRPAQRAYVELAAWRLTAPLLAQASIDITPAIPHDGDLLFVGGNHKLRLLDRRSNRAYGICKEGSNPNFLEQEIHARRLVEELALPVPKLDFVAEDGTWFSESYISGTPLNRLDDPAAARMVLAEMKRSLARLSQHTMRETSVGLYADELAASIRQRVAGNKLLGAEDGGRGAWEERLQKMLNLLAPERGRTLQTTLAHGDFQPANILCQNGASWLIDWELSARRQAGYDALVYAMHSRSPVGLAARLRDFCVAAGSLDGESSWLLANWPGAEWENEEARRVSATLLLLEDLAMQLEENNNSRFVRMGEGLMLLRKEFDDWSVVATASRNVYA